MKTIRRINIQDKPSYFFTSVISINDFNPELLGIYDFAKFNDGSVVFNIVCCDKNNNSPHIVFNNMEYIFRKGGIHSYLIFCKSGKNKKMLDIYIEIINKIKEEMLLVIIDENENGEDFLVMGKDFMKFEFKTNGNLIYNKKLISQSV